MSVESKDKAPPAEECSPGDVFGAMWNTMADVLGTATTATLLRRSVKRASLRTKGLEGLTIERQGFEYSYTLPAPWKDADPQHMVALRGIAEELSPLLRELTGPVVIRRLNTLPQLQVCKLNFQEREDEKEADAGGEHR